MADKLYEEQPLAKIYERARHTPDQVCFHQPIKGKWFEITWKQVLDQASSIAAEIKSQGIEPGSNIAILSKNCAHWIIADLAIWMSGCTSVPLYPTLDNKTMEFILNHCEAKAIFVGKLDSWKKQESAVKNITKFDFPHWPIDGALHWNDLLKKHPDGLGNQPLRKPDELATIIYTSGTTGTPKGVMHHFSNLTAVGVECPEVLGVSASDRVLSYLPLSHVAERLFCETACIYSGLQVYFAESLETFNANVKYSKPTVFLGVPRIWTKFQQGILAKKPKIEKLAKIPLLGSIVRKKVKEGLGFSEARIYITGAAPMPLSLLKWYRNIGIDIREAYAMSENFAYSHYNRHTSPHQKFGFVGESLPGVHVKLDSEKQICVKSIGNMQGYYKEPEKTKETMKDGYLLTGDQGEIDKDGFLKITGRIKDLFKTAKGKYIVPSSIEKKISGIDHVEHVCVTGSGLPQPIAIVCLSETASKVESKELQENFKESMRELNMSLASYERISKIFLCSEEWTVDNGILTPTMKKKRANIEKKYDHVVYKDEKDPKIIEVNIR